MSTKEYKNKYLLSMLAAIFAVSTFAIAPLAFAADGLQLEEITVTARKREESLQETPLAVSAVTAELKSASLRDVQQLADYAPNLYIERNGGSPSGINISIRGVEYSEVDKSFDPSVGVIVDGMYLGTSAGSFLENFDTKRIEVLRGPQGTLFGKNTTGGVIKVVRGDVTGELGGDVSLTLGSDGRQDFKGVVNFGLGDNAGLKVFANKIESDGFIRNTTTGQNARGDDKETYGAAVRWEPTDNFNIQLHYEYNEDNTDSGAFVNDNSAGEVNCIAFGAPIPAACAATDNGSGQDTISTEGNNTTSSEADNLILTANWDIGSFLLTSITTYRDLDQAYLQHFDASPAPFLEFQYFNTWEQSSQEFRATSQFSDSFEFVAGLYFWDVDYEQNWDVFDLFEVVAPFPAGTVGVNGQAQETESIAVFFSGDWHFADDWTLTVGGRWTEEDKDFLGGSSQFYVPGTAPRPNPADTYLAFSRTDSEFSPKIGLTWKPSDDLFVYASYTEGFKSGGFFGRQADFNIDPSYEPEFVETIEIGAKSTILDGRMNFNATVFSSDYEDKQESVLIPVSLINVATVVRNASNLDIFGVELEADVQLTESIRLRGSYGYLDAEYEGFNADLNGDMIVTNNDDLTPRNTPENTFSISGTHTIPLGAGELQSYVTYRWRDDIEGDASNNPRGTQESIINVNANVAYIFGEDQQYRVSAYGTNLTDERESIWRTIQPLLAFRNYNQSRQWGVQFDYNF